MQKYEEHKNSYLAFTAGLQDWGPTPHVITSEACTCRKQLPAVSSLQTSACRQSVPELVRVMVQQLKLLFCAIVISFPSRYEIPISSKQQLLWFFICSLRQLAAGFLSLSEGSFLNNVWPRFQVACYYYFLYRFSATNECHLCFHCALAHAEYLAYTYYQRTAVCFTSGCYLLQVTAEAAGQSREVAS